MRKDQVEKMRRTSVAARRERMKSRKLYKELGIPAALHVERADKMHQILDSGDGPVPRLCDCDQCKGLPRGERYSLLPCGHHGTITLCTCKYKDRRCNICGNVYIQCGPYRIDGKSYTDWYQIPDPHEEKK